MTATPTAVVEIEELQGIIAEGQEKGFLAAETLESALEEADLTRQQISRRIEIVRSGAERRALAPQPGDGAGEDAVDDERRGTEVRGRGHAVARGL